MDIVGYHVFMNVLVNHIKIILSNVGNSIQFLLQVEQPFCSEFFFHSI